MRALLYPLALLAALVACDDTFNYNKGGVTPADDSDAPPLGTGYCALKQVIAQNCGFCHGAGGSPQGGLDLETDPHAALVDMPSSLYAGRTLVVPGDSASSFLINKLTGDLSGEGGAMPPNGALDAATVDVLRAWIDDGATDVCDEVVDPGGNYHPEGWSAPTAHGLAAKLHEQTCTDCHGANLDGEDNGVSCDGCHSDPEWRTNCTFCHGGDDNNTGAPPEDIDDNSDTATLAFRAHTRHVTENTHAPFGCGTCHDKPQDVLTPGHMFDSTPAIAEVTFVNGLSPRGTYLGNGSCSNLYCHGNGQSSNGTAEHSQTMGCTSCHAGLSSGRSGWATMSEPHEDHLREGLSCENCHNDTTRDGSSIHDPGLHVNGAKDVVIEPNVGVTRTGSTCTGTCHGKVHTNESWR